MDELLFPREIQGCDYLPIPLPEIIWANGTGAGAIHNLWWVESQTICYYDLGCNVLIFLDLRQLLAKNFLIDI